MDTKRYKPLSLSGKSGIQLWSYFCVVTLFLIIFGCGVYTRVHGEYYLSQEKYTEGAQVFREKLQQNPFDAEANYYLGRYLLALNQPKNAYPYLKEAVLLSYGSADYHFWLGVCYNGLEQPKMERAGYLKAIELNKRHIESHLYLGHSYLEHGHWKKALDAYEQVLELQHNHAQALYNRGLALNKLQRYSAEIDAWKAYLNYYPEGQWAILAVDHLNSRGDFQYRNYSIGYRRVPLEQIRFEGLTDSLTKSTIPSLDVIGSILSINKKIHLEIIAYCKGNKTLAKRRAKRIQDFLITSYPKIDPRRLIVRGFGKPEKIILGSKVYTLKSSINFTTRKMQ